MTNFETRLGYTYIQSYLECVCTFPITMTKPGKSNPGVCVNSGSQITGTVYHNLEGISTGT